MRVSRRALWELLVFAAAAAVVLGMLLWPAGSPSAAARRSIERALPRLVQADFTSRARTSAGLPGAYDRIAVSVLSWDRFTGGDADAHVTVTLDAPVHRSVTGQWDDDDSPAQWDFGVRRQPNGGWVLTSERVVAYVGGQG